MMTDSQIMILYENSLDSHWRHLVCPKGAFKFYVIALGGGRGPASIDDADDALRGGPDQK